MPQKEIWTCQNNWCTFSIGTFKRNDLFSKISTNVLDTTDKTHTQAKSELERHHKFCAKNYKKGKEEIVLPYLVEKTIIKIFIRSFTTIQENESSIVRMGKAMDITIFRSRKTVLYFKNQFKVTSKKKSLKICKCNYSKVISYCY